jgi:ribosomal protein S14
MNCWGVAPQLSDSRRSSRQSRPARSTGLAASVLRKLWCIPRECSRKIGAIQVPGLGLEMRNLAAKQDKG